MIEMPGFVSGVVRSVGLSTAMKAAGVVTGLLPIPQPMVLVGPGSSKRLGQALAGFGHKRILIVTDATIVRMGLLKGFTQALTKAGPEVRQFDFLESGKSFEALTREVSDFAPSFVGISVRNIDNVNLVNEQPYIDVVRDIVLNVKSARQVSRIQLTTNGLKARCSTY